MDRKKEEILAKRSQLSLAKQALLEKRLRGKLEANSPRELIPRRSQQSPAPLSFSQQRLWFLHQLEPNSPVYNEIALVQLTGLLNKTALEKSFNEIIKRHEVLRTTFAMEDGKPVQIIHPNWDFKLLVEELKMGEEENIAFSGQFSNSIQKLISEEVERPFDLTQGPLLRGTLFHLTEQEHLLLFVMHHIVCDGWSIQVMLRELAVFYDAFLTGKPSSLPELPIQYADFAVWQRQWSEARLQTQLAYWKQQLANVPTLLDLPTDRPRSPINKFQGATTHFQLSSHLTERLKYLSQSAGCTLFMTLLAAFQTLLYRYTGQEDICVGTPIANRNYQETQELIGFFVNTLAMRTDLSGNPSFQELLRRVRSVAINAYANQDLPFEQLVEALHLERNLSHQPLFQVMFGLQDDPIEELVLPGLTISRRSIDNKTAKFDLTLYMVNRGSGLTGLLEYNTDLFDTATINRIVGHFSTLLEGIVAHPEKQLSQLPLLTAAEQHQLLVEWNNSATDYPLDKCLHQLVEEQVERTPDAVAVVFENQQLTYKQLNQRANQLAHYLQKLGVGPEVLVGICVERSLEMMVGLLGILKAGGTYVPLDPYYPQERLAFMLESSQASFLVTQRSILDSTLDNVGELSHLITNLNWVCLDTDWQTISQESSSYPVSNVTAENLAYTIYTSGSTGKPKGVQVLHRALVNCLTSMSHNPGLTDKDIFLSVTTLSFDIAALELFLPLIVGACVVIASREVAADGIQLLKYLADFQATAMQATPATWRMLLASGWQAGNHSSLPKLQKILCGGEALPQELAQQLLLRIASVWNVYGPTETTIWSTIYPVQAESGTVPIGRAIANTQLYILDKYLQPVPVGVPGELHIGGMGVARGYLNRPDLTAEKFIANPFLNSDDFLVSSSELEENSLIQTSNLKPQTSKLYKTGDLVRYLPDGNIEFLGRIDHQVKIRGFRIELGEIESALRQHPAVKEAIVIAREDEPGNKRLVAYIVPVSPSSPSLLRSFLKEKLPDYMVPTAFVMLEMLPLTPNGKVDRKALPIPEGTHFQVETTFVAPRTPVEELLAGTWTQLLKIERIGIHDNFFELGGHSLLATQVISQLRQILQLEIPLQRLFETPTIAGLAGSIETAIKAEQRLANPPIQRVRRNQELQPSFAQQRLWFLNQLAPDIPAYNGSAAIYLKGILNAAALEQSLNEIIHRHEALRTNFMVVEGKLVQFVRSNLTLNLPLIDLQELPEALQKQQVEQLQVQEAKRPFDLTNEPLFRFTLLRLAEKQHILLLSIHHIVSDGWSTGILVREVAALYDAFAKGKPSPLPELPIQYADYAVWQRQWLQGEVLTSQLNYWKRHLGGNLPVLKLSIAKEIENLSSSQQIFQGAKQAFELPESLTHSLKTLSQREGVTLFMTLLAAFKTLLYYYSKQEDILVGSPIANRNRGEIEGLIGFFVNTLILRTDLSENPSFREILQRVREVALGAYAHQDLPFDQLVTELQPERSLTHNPLFQVWFVLQNAPMPPLELPGLTLNLVDIDSGMVRHDLKLDLSETGTGIQGFFEYKTALFDAASIAQMAELLKTVLQKIVEQPDANLSQLIEILADTDKQQLIVKEQEFKAARRQKLGNIGRRAISRSTSNNE